MVKVITMAFEGLHRNVGKTLKKALPLPASLRAFKACCQREEFLTQERNRLLVMKRLLD